jgi:UDP-N-acetylmuramate: L-alanyl-gamma-D-glutamyl-meso-diaminopimelate ligase
MRIHILGIGGTFMGSIALLAQAMGFDVSGTDDVLFPPMSNVLRTAKISVNTDWSQVAKESYDWIIVGNTLSRGGKGKKAIEAMLNSGLPFISGPQWLYENILRHKKVFAVAGTHGKTFTTSLLAWIFEVAKIDAGFLIGGVAKNFNKSARLGSAPFFIIESDEYDTAFFDKRPKFLHYRPNSLILNNLEFDHADIFENLNAIKQQFIYLLRTVPSNGKIIYSAEDKNLFEVLTNAYTKKESAGIDCGDWQAQNIRVSKAGVIFDVYHHHKFFGQFQWTQYGRHYIHNALNAIALAADMGIQKQEMIKALNTFDGVKRRLEVIDRVNDVTIYDDFAHHPTAIKETIDALKSKIGEERLVVILFCETNTLKSGHYNDDLITALVDASTACIITDKAYVSSLQKNASRHILVCSNQNDAIDFLKRIVQSGDHMLIMSTRSIEPFLKAFSAISIEKGGLYAN